MTEVLGWVLVALTVLGLLPASVFCAQIVASIFRNCPAAVPTVSGFRYVVVMPAHDEAQVIASTLSQVIPELGHHGRLLVVADNCRDETAAIARAAGVEVVVRLDEARRGKGYALDFAIRHLAGDPPDVVIVLDADCVPAPGTLQRLAAACRISGQPLQSHYDIAPPDGLAPSPYLRIATFAWRVKNNVRPTGLAALGLPCQLMGTGMAFPWSVIAIAPLATSHIVEDMLLGVQLASRGHPAYFHPETRVTSEFPSSAEGQFNQRKRWETGHIQVILKEVPRYMMLAVQRGDFRLGALALDAAVPPLAFLVLLAVGVFAISALWTLSTGQVIPLITAAAALILIGLGVFIAWLRVGKHIVFFSDIRFVSLYILRKLGIYARALGGRSLEWVRTKRD